MIRRVFRAAILVTCLLGVGSASAGTYYIAANGSDSNSGTSKSSPWLHAPGMPNCSSACLAYQNARPQPGDSIIFRGGDTWHFGNRDASPYTGGTWYWTWSGTSTNCDTTDNPAPTRTSCIYVGVDQTWYSGGAWARPIMTGDNPTSTSTVGSCAYGPVGPKNDFLMVNNNAFAWFDNFEWTGLCSGVASTVGNNYLNSWNLYIVDAGGSVVVVQNVYSNHYAHGWTHLPYSCSEPSGEPVGQCMSSGFITGGIMSTLGPGNVCDGSDSDPHSVQCELGPGYIVFDNVFANQAQVVVNGYHDWHDNYWFNYTNTTDGIAHGNEWEANTDAPGSDSSGHSQPRVPFNVWYNNVEGHTAPTATGDVKVAFCPNTFAAEYWFNNIQYDQAGTGNTWDVATGGFNCSASGHEYMFNNTLDSPGAGALNCVGGMVVTGNHEIVEGTSAFNAGSCRISNEIVMNHARAVTQGYMATGRGTSGSNNDTTCANDTYPCAPTSSADSTIGGGGNFQSYCLSLLASGAGEIARAGTACQNGTTDSCSYNTANHTVNCPRDTPAERPESAAWDAGAYQFSGSQAAVPLPPTNLSITVQ
jgi:hypothetical protein